MLKTLYLIAIAFLFAAVIGLGVAAFYPQPKAPDYPEELNKIGPNGLSEKQEALQKKFEQEQKAYTKQLEEYNLNASLILIGLALLTLAISIIWAGGIELIGDGLTLGGVLTLIYGLGRAVAGGDEKIRFLAVAFGLAVLIFLAYWKYVRPKQPETPKT